MRQREIVRWYSKGYKKGEAERKQLYASLKNVVHQLMKEKPKNMGFLVYHLGAIQGRLGEDRIWKTKRGGGIWKLNMQLLKIRER